MALTINGKSVGPIGFGLMGLTTRNPPVPTEQAIETMRAALEHGANFWNAGTFYGPPDANSLQLLNAYFTKYPEDAKRVVISIKSFFRLAGENPGPDCSPAGIEEDMSNILAVLDGKCFVDVIEPARIDPNVSVEDTLQTLIPYVQSGKVGGIGLSEVKADTIRRAAKVTKISAIELELSLFATEPLCNGQAAACVEYDIPLVAYSPLARGFLTGQFRRFEDLPEGDFRRILPRWQPDVFDENLKLADEVEKLAKKKGLSVAQVAMAWVVALNGSKDMPTIIPLPGATTVARVKENSTLAKLSQDDLKDVQDIVNRLEVKGARYPAGLDKLMDA